MAANSSVGVAPAICAAAVEPADVPMVRSAVVTSSPASHRPAMTPISQALPVDPPPPRTSALLTASFSEVVGVTCGGALFMGVAFRKCLWGAPGGDYVSRASWTAGEHPLWTVRSWGSPPAMDHDLRDAITPRKLRRQ